MNTRIAAIMTKNVVVAKSDNNVLQVLEFFNQFKIQHLPVCVNEHELVGIISVNDIAKFLHKVVKEGKAINESVLKLNYTAADIMTKQPISITSHHTIQDALDILAQGKFQAVPVCDDGLLVGIVTNKDLVRHLTIE